MPQYAACNIDFHIDERQNYDVLRKAQAEQFYSSTAQFYEHYQLSYTIVHPYNNIFVTSSGKWPTLYTLHVRDAY